MNTPRAEATPAGSVAEREPWRLEITSGPLDGHSWRLRAAVNRIGADVECECAVPQDPALAPEHARLESAGDELTLSPRPGARVAFGARQAEEPEKLTAETEFVCGSTWMRATRVRPAATRGLSTSDTLARLDETANRLLSQAASRSEAAGCRYLMVEHLALALAGDPGLSSAVPRALVADLETALRERATPVKLAELVFTPRLLRVLALACDSSGAGRVTPAALLEAIAKEGRSRAAHLFAEHRMAFPLAGRPEVAAASSTLGPILSGIGRDLTALARADKLPPLIGRAAELDLVLQILGRARKNNPVIVGEPGIGKTCLVEGVARRAIQPDAPGILRGKHIIEISPGALVAGTQYRGQFEERLLALVREAARPDVILFIDEIHLLVGAGRADGVMMDAGNLLKPALARGEITVIGATTHAEFRRSIEKDQALERRFDPVFLAEPTPDQAIEIATGLTADLTRHHGLRFTPEAIAAAVHLSVRHLPERHLPDKAVDLLDRAASRRNLRGTAGAGAPPVSRADIAEALSDWIGRPVESDEAESAAGLLDLEQKLGARVLGQEAAIASVAGSLRMARAGMKSGRGPLGVFLFAGPSGVGKTELGRALAEVLFGGEQAFIKLDMSEYQERHSISRLIGAPPGYVGHGDGGVLTEAIRRRPSAVVVFDEIEKAAREICDVFLQIFDEGKLTDGQGRTTDFRGTVVVLTSNLRPDQPAEKRIGGFRGGAPDPVDVRKALGNTFRPELVNRIDEVIAFRALDDAVLAKLVERHLAPAREQLAKKGATLELADGVVTWLAREGQVDQWGARELERAVQRRVAQPLAALLLAGKVAAGSVVRVKPGEQVLDVEIA